MTALATTAPGRWRWPVAAFAALFGLATVVSGGRVLFGPEVARVEAGQFLPGLVLFNFLAGFLYVAAAVGLALGRRWAARLAALLGGATLLAFAAFGLFVAAGGGYEPRTVVAMAFRAAFWLAVARLALR